ncbi:MAG: rho guanine nucleotide exchange factor, partial [archaeon]|nr:rho guanine nucleotide exchange factor [archaeon]
MSSLVRRIQSLEKLLKLAPSNKGHAGTALECVSESQEMLECATHHKCAEALVRYNRRPTLVTAEGGMPRRQTYGEAAGSGSHGDKTTNVINEILATEKAYAADLEIFVAVFLKPMWDCRMLPQRELELVGGVEEFSFLIRLHRDQVQCLDTSSTVQSVCSSFRTLLPKMKEVYATILKRQKECLELLGRYSDPKTARSPFSRWLTVAQSDPRCRKLFLRDFLIKPLQRVCRYPLLLRELAQHLAPDSADAKALQAVRQTCDLLVSHCNTQARLMEESQEVLAVAMMFEGTGIELAAAGRIFLAKGKLKLVSVPSHQSRSIHVFLFSDIVVFAARKSSKKFLFQRIVPLETMTLRATVKKEF